MLEPSIVPITLTLIYVAMIVASRMTRKVKVIPKTFIANIKPLKTTQHLKGFLTMLEASKGVA